MKNYFIANGEVLNTNMSIEEMESRVQESLGENTSGMAQFRIKEISVFWFQIWISIYRSKTMILPSI